MSYNGRLSQILIVLILLVFICTLYFASNLNVNDSSNVHKRSSSTFTFRNRRYDFVERRKDWPHLPCFDRVVDDPANRDYPLICWPAYVVVGYKKAATSAFYQFTRRHPQVLHNGKFETYARRVPLEATSAGSRSQFSFEIFTHRHNGRTHKLRAPDQIYGVSLWHDFDPVEDENFAFLSDVTQPLVLLRQPDEWVYAVWKFWCIRGYDAACASETTWAGGNGSVPRTAAEFERVLIELCTAVEGDASYEFSSRRCPLHFPDYQRRLALVSRRFRRRCLVVLAERLASPTTAVQEVNRLLVDALGLSIRLNNSFGEREFNFATNVNGVARGVQATTALEAALGRKSTEPMTNTSRLLLRRLINYDEILKDIQKVLPPNININDYWF